jgi:predicted MFS family arabinose efflux permease
VHGDRFDWAGAVTFMAGLSVLLFALNRGHDWGWLTLRTLALLGLAGIILALFIRLERRPGPMLDLSLFRRRLFSTATASAMLNYICLYSIMFLLPFYLIQGRGLDTAQAGLILMAQPIVMAITAPLSGALSDRIGSRLLSTVGMAILALGLLLLALLGPVSPLSQVAVALAVAGLGTGIFISPNTSALMGAAPRDRQGIAAAVMATARNLGMALGWPAPSSPRCWQAPRAAQGRPRPNRPSSPRRARAFSWRQRWHWWASASQRRAAPRFPTRVGD